MKFLVFFLFFGWTMEALASFPDTVKPQLSLQILDKVTGRTKRIEIENQETISFGTLRLRARRCHKSAPEEAPESTAYLEVWEEKPLEEPVNIFNGWMFSSSPAAIEHPVYDVRLLDCHHCTTCCQQKTEEGVNLLPVEPKTVSPSSVTEVTDD